MAKKRIYAMRENLETQAELGYIQEITRALATHTDVWENLAYQLQREGEEKQIITIWENSAYKLQGEGEEKQTTITVEGEEKQTTMTVAYNSLYSLLSWATEITSMTEPHLVHSANYGNEEAEPPLIQSVNYGYDEAQQVPAPAFPSIRRRSELYGFILEIGFLLF